MMKNKEFDLEEFKIEIVEHGCIVKIKEYQFFCRSIEFNGSVYHFHDSYFNNREEARKILKILKFLEGFDPIRVGINWHLLDEIKNKKE